MPGAANTTPLWTYQHGAAGTSVTGGVVYTGSSYPAEYQGAYFFGDYASQRVYTLCHDDQGRLVRAPEADGFGAGNGVPVAFAAAPDNGDLVWADIRGNVLERLVYAPGNRPPTARATATVDAATRTVTFDGSASSEWDGEPLTLHWDFGDGTSGEGVTVQHTYADPGPVTARLTVTDPGGAEDSTTLPVVPGNSAPVLTLNPPPPGRRYVPGDLVEATAEATDAEDGPLTVRWTEVLVHCSAGLCHEHPGESFEGPAYSRPFVDHGEGTRMVVTAGATDSAGVEVRASFEALPVTAV